jgi:hypothetical protein
MLMVFPYSFTAEMIVNFDQTGLSIVPTSSWTLAEKGAKQVEIVGLDDKRQITALLGCSLTGDLLPLQLIYTGKTDKCHPSYAFPDDWQVTHSESHWSTSKTMEDYVRGILVPYFDRVRAMKQLPADQPALCLMDVFRAHRVDSVQQLLASNNIRVIFVSACCTGDLQPLDLSGNGDFKASLKECFIAWFADHLAAAFDNGISTQPDLRLSTLKPLHGQWVVRAWEALRDKSNVLIHGWEQAGIKGALNETTLIID